LDTEFRHYPSRARIIGEPVRRAKRAIGENAGHLRRIAGDEEADRLKIFERLRGQFT
jgi:hypothetical protein